MRTKSLLLGLVSIPLLAQVSPVPLSEAEDVVPAFDSSGAIALPAARVKLDIAYPRSKKERRELTVVYDPKTGHYLWHLAAYNPNIPDDTGLYLNVMKEHGDLAFADPAGLIHFGFGDALWVKAWRGRAGSLDAAVSASIDEIRQGLVSHEGGAYHTDYKHVAIFGPREGFKHMPPAYKSIPPEFKCKMPNAFCPGDDNKIASISRLGTNWRLVLRNRYDVEVILDQNFSPVSTQQLTQPKE